MNDKHPGDIVLNAVLREILSLFDAPIINARKRLLAFLKPRLKSLKRGDDEDVTDYNARLISAFTGPMWRLVKKRIAREFTAASTRTHRIVNDALGDSFTAGFNETAYTLSLSGVKAFPITLAAVLLLEEWGVINLEKRNLKKREATLYNEHRVQNAVIAAIAMGIPVQEIADHVSRRIGTIFRNEATAYARASIYTASDSGAYEAGIEAANDGVDVEKTWLAIMDMKVRPSHSRLHGTTIPIREKFHGDYGLLRHPHDPSAPPEEVYNCRCRMAVHLVGKSPGEYSRNLLPAETREYKLWRDEQIRRLGTAVELARAHRRRLRR